MVLWPGSSLFPWGDPPCAFRVWSSCILFCNAQSPSDRPLSPRHPVQSIHSIRRLSIHFAIAGCTRKRRRRDAEGEPAILHPHQQLQPQRLQPRACKTNLLLLLSRTLLLLCTFFLLCNSLQRLCFGRLQLFFFLRRRGHRGLNLALPQLLPPVPQPALDYGPPSPDCGIHLQPRYCFAGASSSSSFLPHTTLFRAVSSPVALPSVCWDPSLLASLLAAEP